MSYEAHPLADALPALRKNAYQELVADVQANGLLEPITLFEGKVLDGRNRLRACQEAGIEPQFVEYTGGNPVAFVLSKNVTRRHLTASQKAMAVVKMSEVVAQLQVQADARKRTSLNKGNQSPLPSRDGNGDERATSEEGAETNDSPPAEPAQSDNKHDNTTAAQLGKLADVSEKTVERAKYVHDHGTADDVKEVESGEKSVKRKAKEVRQRQENNKSGYQSSAGEPGPGQEEPQPEAEGALTRKEWKTCIQTLKHTLLLDCSNLSPGETRDQVARFQRALHEKTISKKARKEMKTAVAELMERCQEVLRYLE